VSDPYANDGFWVRGNYDVPAEIGGEVVFDGVHAVITGFRGAYVLILRDGDTESVPVHPTWHMTYLPASDSTPKG
jgi:hypothetical protein